jgi:HD-GYP domain-containing protein (c-di-GMP phosphodiesterase class II)
VECIRYGVHDFITKPFNVVEVMATIERALRKRRSRGQLHSFLDRLGNILGHATPGTVALSAIEADDHLVAEVREALTESFRPITRASTERVLEFAEVLADTLESKDAYTHGHSRRVSYYAGLLAEHAELQPDLRDEIRLAAFLHDVGKIGVANQLILKDGRLTQEERILVMKHPVIGESLIQPLGLAPGILQAVRHHHEHFDGSGYPDKLAGNEIPLGARVILIADAYDAMHSQRSYRKGFQKEMIIREFTKHSGTQFDPHLTAAFLDLMEKREDAFATEI